MYRSDEITELEKLGMESRQAKYIDHEFNKLKGDIACLNELIEALYDIEERLKKIETMLKDN